ncbi:hypothetical protein ACJU26_00240 [Acidithiobacillus sp. M4-SHS-6]|uniref:hypothetical protein n=1 Tax=Acidithiobacillus sp. M4-SHS-6 TaxID=3383024 RepID=UPI0039BE2F9D
MKIHTSPYGAKNYISTHPIVAPLWKQHHASSQGTIPNYVDDNMITTKWHLRSDDRPAPRQCSACQRDAPEDNRQAMPVGAKTIRSDCHFSIHSPYFFAAQEFS